ncbi:hypothetical protein F4703DRAFT_1942226 [Phycomyces blakesleeanus]
MSPSDLPVEILTKAAGFVSKYDLLQCTYVCRAWKEPFQDVFMQELVLSGTRTINNAVNPSANIYSQYQRYGHLVRRLTLKPKRLTANEKFLILQQHFPHIRSLCISELGLDNSLQADSFDWSSWGKITELDITIRLYGNTNPQNESLDTLRSFRNLRRLSFLSCIEINSYGIDIFDYGKVGFAFHNIETLHTYLPQLEYLKLETGFGVFSKEDLMDIQNILPAKKMSTLIITSGNLIVPWLCYFAQKYPNLKMLELQSGKAPRTLFEPNDPYTEIAISRFLNTSSAFNHLHKVMIKEYDVQERIFPVFWKILSPSNTTINSVSYITRYTKNNWEHFKKIIKIPSGVRSTTLKALFIQARTNDAIAAPITGVVELCPNLVYLNLECEREKVELDVILDQCSRIRKLRIHGGQLVTSKYATLDSPVHGLERIDMLALKVDCTVFSYISSRCRSLSHMNLQYMRIYGFSQETRELCISMPHTKLSELLLYAVSLHLSDEHPRSDTDIKFILTPKVDNSDRSDTTTVDRISSYTWRYMFWVSCAYTYRKTDMREMDNEEVEHATQYFNQFKPRNSIVNGLEKHMAIEGCSDIYEWEKDLPNGYAIFECLAQALLIALTITSLPSTVNLDSSDHTTSFHWSKLSVKAGLWDVIYDPKPKHLRQTIAAAAAAVVVVVAVFLQTSIFLFFKEPLTLEYEASLLNPFSMLCKSRLIHSLNDVLDIGQAHVNSR